MVYPFTRYWTTPGRYSYLGLAEEHVHGTFSIGVFEMVNALFCAGAVMISYGAILGKVTPTQMVIMGNSLLIT
jgi:hypothetical protein